MAKTADPHATCYFEQTRVLDDHERRITDLEGFDVEMRQTLKETNQQLTGVTIALNLLTGKFDVVLKIVYGLTTVSIVALFGMVFEIIYKKFGG